MGKANSIYFIVIILLLIVDIAVDVSARYSHKCACRDNSRHATAPVAQSYATPYKDVAAVKLPEPGESYKVIGQVPGLKNFVVQYDDQFYRGGELLSIEGMENLKKWGIRTIFSVTPTDLERLLAERYGIKLIELNFDKKQGIPDTVLKKYLSELKTGNGPFYVHCHGGTHRGGALGTAYRVLINGWDIKKAMDEYKALGGNPTLDDKAMMDSIKEFKENAHASE